MGQESTHLNNNMQEEEISIPLWEYNRQKHKWLQKQFDKDYEKNSCEKFRVVTYNIWFSKNYQPMRFNALCDILNKSNAQIIGLQEMTVDILQQLLEQPFIQQRYYLSDVDGRTFNGWYGVILLIDIRIHVSNLNLIHFSQSTMGRRLLIAEIKLDQNEILHIGTVHLESLNNKKERAHQLEICQNRFNRFPGSYILMGDFNINADHQENIDQFKILRNWIDLWVYLMNHNNHGYTFDTEANSITKLNHGHIYRSRCDRIILNSQNIMPTHINIIGNQSIGHLDNLHIFPSDHFGLTALFEKK